jgi:hypothetical protein
MPEPTVADILAARPTLPYQAKTTTGHTITVERLNTTTVRIGPYIVTTATALDLSIALAQAAHTKPTTPPPPATLGQAICGCPLHYDTGHVDHINGCPYPAASAEAAAWNNKVGYQVGVPVRYWDGNHSGQGRLGRTSSTAQVIGGYAAVVFLQGVSHAVPLSHVELLENGDSRG